MPTHVPSSVTVRPADVDDFAALGALTAVAYLAGEVLPTGSAYLEQLADPAGRAEGCDLLVAVAHAEPDPELVGGVSLVHSGSPQAELAGPGEAEIRMLAVAPAAQGRGVATLLMQSCLERAVAAGYGALVLCVIAGNEPAHRLYRGFGFVRDPGRDWTPEPGVDLLAYRLGLPGPDRA